MLEGIILTSPALHVKPAHPIVGVSKMSFSLILILEKASWLVLPVKTIHNILMLYKVSLGMIDLIELSFHVGRGTNIFNGSPKVPIQRC